jgi:hypothetical protein
MRRRPAKDPLESGTPVRITREIDTISDELLFIVRQNDRNLCTGIEHRLEKKYVGTARGGGETAADAVVLNHNLKVFPPMNRRLATCCS